MASTNRYQRQTHRAVNPAGPLTLLDAIADDALFAPWFSRNPAGWTAWFSFLKALFGLPLSGEQARIFRECTGRTENPSSVAREIFLICGRRSGKSFILALVAVWLACFHSYRKYLAPGERGTIFIVASDRRQARTILRYITALLTGVPALSRLVTRTWAEGFDLSTNISIEVGTASHRSLRGYAIVACLLDEAAFMASDEDAASTDSEIITAVKPGMAQFPNSMLLVASSPYAKRGALYDAHREHYGKNGDNVLVWQAPTRTMNPTIDQSIIDEAMAKDPASAAAEWLGQFRNDIESFISREAVEACISEGIRERAPEQGVNYSAFVDPAGGSGKDSFTLAIAHKDKKTGMGVLDCIREVKPPFSPEQVAQDFAATLKSYGITKALSDKFAGAFPVEAFKRNSITLEQSAKPKSDLYRDFLPLLNSKRVDLLDHPRLVAQLSSLERRTARSGKDSIDHAPSAHDDVANVVAGALTNIQVKKYAYDVSMNWVSDGEDDARLFQRMQRNFYMTGGRRL
ncbi:hypothetical protein [Afipia clevelandensis]|uniref:Uncharacterized protein n=1 Tax=Afipia clevelandensis ATCC 49720 TaxID=883079 RepID=K8PHY9_9BRAD|nr:hypothetical protein [Afipia clevelandensis]EKS40409.1 hypothetical protein HMPREF9696_00860 [Afipia clevelandensis ATCC 49720]